ncbi:MAG: hypothetical protein LBN29_10420 [Mediterranea sp.]|jgi:hypothetical protein|nr:hypothetical protein [Mediterranea sp.]
MADRSLHEKLARLVFQPLKPLLEREEVSVREKGNRYRLSLRPPLQSVVYQVDGEIITEGEKCDKMVLVDKGSNDEWIQILVELKGTKISKAIEQLENTLQNKTLQHPSNKDKRARIVGRSFPGNNGNTIMAEAKKRFMKEYKCELRSLKSDQPDTISAKTK